MAKGTLQINILGTSFSIQADEDSLYLDKVYRRYSEAVENVTKTTALKESIKIAVLAGIMVTDELLKERAKNSTANTDSRLASAELSEAEKITLQLINKIDDALLPKTQTKPEEKA